MISRNAGSTEKGQGEDSALLLRLLRWPRCEEWLARQSRSNRSLHQNFLLTGKLTRNFAVSGVVLQICHPINAKFQSLAVKFPSKRTGNFLKRTGKLRN